LLGVTISALDDTTYQIFAPSQLAMDEAKEIIDELLSDQVQLIRVSLILFLAATSTVLIHVSLILFSAATSTVFIHVSLILFLAATLLACL